MSDAVSSRAPLAVADQVARDLVTEFALPLVRVWLVEPPDVECRLLLLAATATLEPNAMYGGMREDSVALLMRARRPAADVITTPAESPRFSTPLPDGSFLGLPIVDGDQRFAFVEVYTNGPLGLGLAGELEKRTNELAAVLFSARMTSELEGAPRGRILIADDDAGVRTLVRRLLTAQAFEVIDVSNGMLACERAREEPFDLILLDWMMPVMDGPSATAKLKADPQTRGIPIVMLTSQSRIDDKVTALEAGAQDFITKPFDSRELVARIEQQLRWRRLLADDVAGAPEPDGPAHAALDLSDIVPATGDLWTQAVEASQLGKHREALALFMQEAENCDRSEQYPRAAIAYRSASIEAGNLHNLDLSNKLLRLSGKMYLCWAESATESKSIQDAYLNAARSFLTAGNLKLAKKSVDFASSIESVLADDRPPPLVPLGKRRA
ncbi:MAG TPA: response regulator [Candidatus Acidoferrales bacterium]|nr:response regulator [Candidatus Acidoferrales bacterium]